MLRRKQDVEISSSGNLDDGNCVAGEKQREKNREKREKEREREGERLKKKKKERESGMGNVEQYRLGQTKSR